MLADRHINARLLLSIFVNVLDDSILLACVCDVDLVECGWMDVCIEIVQYGGGEQRERELSISAPLSQIYRRFWVHVFHLLVYSRVPSRPFILFPSLSLGITTHCLSRHLLFLEASRSRSDSMVRSRELDYPAAERAGP